MDGRQRWEGGQAPQIPEITSIANPQTSKPGGWGGIWENRGVQAVDKEVFLQIPRMRHHTPGTCPAALHPPPRLVSVLGPFLPISPEPCCQ